jgi:hypothetical protein
MERAACLARAEDAREVVHPGGRKREPPGAGVSPVAFATAAISMADFVPSRNELNICAFSPLALASSGGIP